MDFPLIQTFLTLVETANVRVAAERMHLTKSAVSARLRQLEVQIGHSLFQRGSEGLLLNQHGRRFHRHALALQQRWERAQREMRLSDGDARYLSLGVHAALGEDLLLPWAERIGESHPDWRVHLEADYSAVIVPRVAAGLLDVGVIYVAETRPGLEIETLFEDQLIMVSSDGEWLAEIDPARYVFADWGSGYDASHSNRLPMLAEQGAYLGLGSLVLPFLRRRGGTAYLPKRTATPVLQSGEFRLVRDAPPMARPVYVTYASSALNDESVTEGLYCLRAVASSLPH